MKEFLKAVKELVERLYKEGRPGDISKEIKALAKQYKIGEQGLREAKKIQNAYQSNLEDEFIKKFTKEFTVSEFDRISENFQKNVVESVKRSMRSSDPDIAVKAVKRLGVVAERNLRTVVQTAKDGINQAQVIEDAKNSGVKQMRYVGPKTSLRLFCSEHIGKIYTIEEIKNMSNGQGLPVMYFGGGYNCRHRWVAVEGEEQNGVFLHESFKAKYGNNVPKVVAEEIKGAELLAAHGKVEINPYRQEQEKADTDLFFDGKPAQLKQTNSQNENILRQKLRDARHQADNVIIIFNGLPDEDRSVYLAKEWLRKHPEKKLYFYNKKTQKFKEI